MEEYFTQKDYRSFLRVLYSNLKHSRKTYSYALFAKDSGFSSKSFLPDVINGTKKLTSSSAAKITKGLDMPVEMANYFLLLVALEEGSEEEQYEVQKKIQQLQKRVLATIAPKPILPTVSHSQKYWREVYAALGEHSVGASLEEVQLRTRLSATICVETLEWLLKNELAYTKVNTQHYYPIEPHLIYSKMGSEKSDYPAFYVNTLQRFSRCAQTLFTDEEKLFFSSVFSIEKDRIPHLKERLRQVVLEFVDENESANGDQISHLALAWGHLPQ